MAAIKLQSRSGEGERERGRVSYDSRFVLFLIECANEQTKQSRRWVTKYTSPTCVLEECHPCL